MRFLRSPRWSPYLVGAAIGVLSWITALFMGHALGVSTAFARLSGAAVAAAAPDHVRANPYWASYLVGRNAFGWEEALVAALALGAFVAARLSAQERYTETVPSLWAARFGSSRTLRFVAAFLGGALLVFGARLAGGCTSGHALSGGMRLAVSSYVFVLALFAAGVGTAYGLYRVDAPGAKGDGHV